ncbi:UNVERIFIED_CONTAM: protein TIC, chloroplastic [Sesamum indicum]
MSLSTLSLPLTGPESPPLAAQRGRETHIRIMKPSVLLTTTPSSPHPKTLFFTPFLSSTTALRRSSTHLRRDRCKISRIRSSGEPSSPAVKPDVFGEKRELMGLQSLVDAMSPPIRIASSVLIVAAAVGAGYGLGSRFGGSRNAGLGGAVIVGAAGAGAAYALNACVPEVAAANLHNYVVGCDDPGAIKKEDIEAIANKYGVSKQNEAFNAELCDIYCRFVSAVLPPESEDLKGDEVETIIKFKSSLGIDDPDAAAMHMEIGRRIFRQRLETGDRDADMAQRRVVKEAVEAGVNGYDAEIKKSVRKAAFGLRLTREVAMSIASKAVRRIFISYIQRARAAGSRTESAKELKKMIAFNSLVVTELVADIKGESADTPPTEEQTTKEEQKAEDDEEWESLQSLRKARPSKDISGKPSQKEINLRDDLPDRDRADLYKTYLLFCLTGEVTRIPFGAQITTKKDDSEYLLLNQLGGILGLTDKEIVEVHRGLAEQAFRQEAENLLADGQLTKQRIEQLNELQKSVGLPPQYAQKIIKSITSTKLSAALETAVGRGRLSIKEIRELKENGVDVDNMISESLRENLFKKTIDDIFSSGTGDFDEEEVYEKIPKDLNIDAKKAKGVVHELARNRLSNSLVQAVALLRQRNHQGVVNSLNDLLACDKAVPSTPLSWEVPEELADLFLIYMKNDPAADKVARIQYLLDISDSTAEALKAVKDKGLPNGATTEEEFVF